MKKIYLLIYICLFTHRCAHSVHLVQANDFNNTASEKTKTIESQSEQFVILGFVTQTNYVDKALENLKSQCPNGEIKGLVTRYSTSLGFFSWTNKLIIKGLCYT
jgi:hypothetical protein